ncbi:MAG: aldo/keto reductase [Tahibacter sp.]
MRAGGWIVSNSGVRSPRILYGTAWKKGDTAALVQQALDCGFRGIDTACQPKHYNEPGVGDGIAASLDHSLSRDDLFLQTKFTPYSGQDPQHIPYDAHAPLPEQVAQSCAASLRNLRTTRIDSLLLHSPLPDFRQTLQVWQALERLVDAGSVGQIGISNCYDVEVFKKLHDAARIKPSVVQNRFHAPTGYDKALRAWCRARDIVYQSFWTLTANPTLLAHATVRTLAARHERTAAQILFRYLTQIDVVPLTGTRREIHMREDLAILDFELAAEEIDAVTALL